MADRALLIAAVLEGVAEIARELTAARSGPFGERRLSRSQLDALFVLAHSRSVVTSGDLSEALSITPGAVTQLIAGLRDAGVVETSTSADDGRVRVIGLTSSARAQVDAFEKDAVARMTPAFAGLSDGQLHDLERLLTHRAGAR